MFAKRIEEVKYFRLLSWAILELKYFYYVLHTSYISDNRYDELEKEYEALGKKLNKPLSASAVGIDEGRESVKLIAKNISGKKKLCIDKVLKIKKWSIEGAWE